MDRGGKEGEEWVCDGEGARAWGMDGGKGILMNGKGVERNVESARRVRWEGVTAVVKWLGKARRK